MFENQTDSRGSSRDESDLDELAVEQSWRIQELEMKNLEQNLEFVIKTFNGLPQSRTSEKEDYLKILGKARDAIIFLLEEKTKLGNQLNTKEKLENESHYPECITIHSAATTPKTLKKLTVLTASLFVLWKAKSLLSKERGMLPDYILLWFSLTLIKGN